MYSTKEFETANEIHNSQKNESTSGKPHSESQKYHSIVGNHGPNSSKEQCHQLLDVDDASGYNIEKGLEGLDLGRVGPLELSSF